MENIFINFFEFFFVKSLAINGFSMYNNECWSEKDLR